MKKSIILILLSFVTITTNAQVNWVVRAGLGTTSASSYNEIDGPCLVASSPSLSAGIESSIALRKGGLWLFSPSLNVNVGFGSSETSQVYLSPLFGKRIRVGQGCSIVPKFGLVMGYTIGKKLDDITDKATTYSNCKINQNLFVGPEVAFAFEYKNFVLSANTFYSFMQSLSYDDYLIYDGEFIEPFFHADLTIGYKF